MVCARAHPGTRPRPATSSLSSRRRPVGRASVMRDVASAAPRPTLVVLVPPSRHSTRPSPAWFRSRLGEPTRAQALGWPPVARGESTLLLAPTGSGKTLAAFLVRDRPPRARAAAQRARARRACSTCRRSRRSRSTSSATCARPSPASPSRRGASGVDLRVPTVGVRTGDTPARIARAWRARPPTSSSRRPSRSICSSPRPRARCSAASRRSSSTRSTRSFRPSAARTLRCRSSGSRRCAAGAPPLQRIGLSATQRPLDEVARLLGGFDGGEPRARHIVDAGRARSSISLGVESVERRALSTTKLGDAGRPRRAAARAHERLAARCTRAWSSWSAPTGRRSSSSTAAASPSAWPRPSTTGRGRRSRSRTTARSRARSAPPSRSGSKRGELRAIVATSSLELGIDMGAVDLVIQIESPPSVASGLQRIGRACHGVGGVPRGRASPEAPAGPPRLRRRGRDRCARARSRRRSTRATRSTSSRSRSSPCVSVEPIGVDDALRARPRARPRSPTCPAPRSRACSTC